MSKPKHCQRSRARAEELNVRCGGGVYCECLSILARDRLGGPVARTRAAIAVQATPTVEDIAEVFESMTGNPEHVSSRIQIVPIAATRSVWRIVKHRAKEAELGDTQFIGLNRALHTHDTRHHFARTVLNAGAGLSVVQDLLGHAYASPATTKQIYATSEKLADIPLIRRTY